MIIFMVAFPLLLPLFGPLARVWLGPCTAASNQDDILFATFQQSIPFEPTSSLGNHNSSALSLSLSLLAPAGVLRDDKIVHCESNQKTAINSIYLEGIEKKRPKNERRRRHLILPLNT